MIATTLGVGLLVWMFVFFWRHLRTCFSCILMRLVQKPLYFVQIDSEQASGEDHESYAQKSHLYEEYEVWLVNNRWTMIPWFLEFPTFDSHRNLWFDRAHPKACQCLAMLCKWINHIKMTNENIKDLLIVGDSTIAGCFGDCSECEGCIKRTDLELLVKVCTGVTVYIFSQKGAAFSRDGNNFTQQCELAFEIAEGQKYDAVFLVGGWNEVWLAVAFEQLNNIRKMFHSAACKCIGVKTTQ
jgi:hypothetical protein